MAHNRLVIDGSLLAGAERFSCTLGFGALNGDVVPGPVELSAWADACLVALGGSSSWAVNLRGCLGTGGSVTRVRAYRYVNPSTPAVASGVSSSGPAVGTGSITMPPQCSVVASLITGFAGRSYRGRIYWPRLTGALGNTGKITGAPLPATMAADFASMLRNFAVNSGVAALEPVVVSGFAPSGFTVVNQVSVGDVVDTQRRRRDALIEVRSFADVP